ncbi:PREDICTED: uncharacterized protein LOC104727040 [Camelina sativa]|uniref:Uncharacterized protein LOC104727040 n=1 Tax=Camelina sativa TaxID=90675 RepID=A0ABM0UPY5_CAMSA|nr:PREDICTED: uncharacterized protein LOC104727040 [Camelina sativa]
MDFSVKPLGGSPSPSSSTSSSTPHRFKSVTTPSASAAAVSGISPSAAADRDPMHSWWESVSKQRSRILSLSSLLSGDSHSENGDVTPISSLADSDRPALSLLSSRAAYSWISSSLCNPASGSGSDPLCQWLYETYLSSDPPLRLVVLSFLPLLVGMYLSRIHSIDSSSLPSLSGFEAVLLAIFAAEVKSRGGKPILVHIPDLSQPSLYHSPRNDRSRDSNPTASVGVLSPQLEPQIAVKSTKRASIVGVGLQCYFKEISQMPAWSKLEFCKFSADWAGQDCDCKEKIDGDEDKVLALTNGFGDSSSFNGSSGRSLEIEEYFDRLAIRENEEHSSSSDGVGGRGVRIPLPWELFQPTLRILGHCLLSPLSTGDVKDAASNAVRSLYARASHDLNPQAILATRSLVNLDTSARTAAAKTVAAETVNGGSSNVNTPSKAKKPEILLASK